MANRQMADALDLPLTLRLEDIDRSRARPQFEAAIVDDMSWLGIGWTPPMRRQSEHMAAYQAAMDGLRARNLVYPSFSTRREIASTLRDPGVARDPDGAPLFPGDEHIIGIEETQRRRRTDAPAAWRLSMTAAASTCEDLAVTVTDAAGVPRSTLSTDPLAWGDVVLARKDTPTSYHLSVVVDDAVQSISHVVRGADLLAATAVHKVLQSLLGLPTPLYHHHRLILGADGRKLSKSNGAASLKALRENGVSAADVLQKISAFTAGPAR